MSAMENSLDIDNHCLNKVKIEDNDRYQVIILTSEVYHKRLFAVAAYNIELAHCLENISDPMLSQIKLQWWVEALEDAKAGNVREHPVLQSLNNTALISNNSTYAALKSLCEYRLDSIVLPQNQSLSVITQYARRTSGELHRLFTSLLGATDEDVLKASEDIGTAFGLLGFLKAICFKNTEQIDLLPIDTIESEGLTRPDLMHQDLTHIIIKACRDMSSTISELILSARQTPVKHEKNVTGLFQLAIYVENDLKLMRQHDFNAKEINLEQGHFTLLCKSIWNMFRGTF